MREGKREWIGGNLLHGFWGIDVRGLRVNSHCHPRGYDVQRRPMERNVPVSVYLATLIQKSMPSWHSVAGGGRDRHNFPWSPADVVQIEHRIDSTTSHSTSLSLSSRTGRQRPFYTDGCLIGLQRSDSICKYLRWRHSDQVVASTFTLFWNTVLVVQSCENPYFHRSTGFVCSLIGGNVKSPKRVGTRER